MRDVSDFGRTRLTLYRDSFTPPQRVSFTFIYLSTMASNELQLLGTSQSILQLAATVTELDLCIENVELKIAMCDTDAQFERCINLFLAPVLLKLASPHEQVKRKVCQCRAFG